jgi:hypothetical protein
MSLPLTRNTTYSAGSQVKSADLNDLQDMIIGKKHGSISRVYPASLGIGDGTAGLTYDNGYIGGGIGHWTNVNAPATHGIVDFPIDLVVGEIITAITIYLHTGGAAGEDITGRIYDSDMAGSLTKINGDKVSGITSGFETISWTTADAGIPLTVVDGHSYFLSCELGGGSTAGEVAIRGYKVTSYLP